MPTSMRVVGQKFYAKLNNGDDFTENTSDFSLHLKGGVLEEIKAVFNIQVGWYTEIEGGTSVRYADLANNTLRLQVDGKDFSLDGFAVGDEVKLTDVAYLYKGIITSMSVGEIMLDVTERLDGAIGQDGYGRPAERLFLTGTGFHQQ